MKATQREGAGGLRWWELVLECGHVVERSARYEKGASNGRRGWAVLHHPAPFDKMLPAPNLARCVACSREVRES